MYQVQQRCTSGWRPVARGVFRTLMKAVTAARCRTALQGSDHRIMDLSLKTVVEVVTEASIQPAPDRRLRSGFLRELTRPLNEQSIGMGPPTPASRRAGRTVPRAIQRLIKREQM